MISLIYGFMTIPLILAVVFSIWKGFDYLKGAHPGWEAGFVIFSGVALLLGLALFPITNKYVRGSCAELNKELIDKS